ncbi:hypothetical protein VTK73DRAFT_5504 [Phialemonium thermophilum]|uniref:Uncharacterized protein n=1 Tax=Phialemonium thermophilum TaxID=223376 RepID=A0ABR3WNY3_9PEZI
MFHSGHTRHFLGIDGARMGGGVVVWKELAGDHKESGLDVRCFGLWGSSVNGSPSFFLIRPRGKVATLNLENWQVNVPKDGPRAPGSRDAGTEVTEIHPESGVVVDWFADAKSHLLWKATAGFPSSVWSTIPCHTDRSPAIPAISVSLQIATYRQETMV